MKETREILEQYYIDSLPSTGSTRAHSVVIAEAGAKLDALIAEKVAEAEDKALTYAAKLHDLTKQWPDYYSRQLNGDRYRKQHKNVKIALRSELTPPPDQKEAS